MNTIMFKTMCIHRSRYGFLYRIVWKCMKCSLAYYYAHLVTYNMVVLNECLRFIPMCYYIMMIIYKRAFAISLCGTLLSCKHNMIIIEVYKRVFFILALGCNVLPVCGNASSSWNRFQQLCVQCTIFTLLSCAEFLYLNKLNPFNFVFRNA